MKLPQVRRKSRHVRDRIEVVDEPKPPVRSAAPIGVGPEDPEPGTPSSRPRYFPNPWGELTSLPAGQNSGGPYRAEMPGQYQRTWATAQQIAQFLYGQSEGGSWTDATAAAPEAITPGELDDPVRDQRSHLTDCVSYLQSLSDRPNSNLAWRPLALSVRQVLPQQANQVVWRNMELLLGGPTAPISVLGRLHLVPNDSAFRLSAEGRVRPIPPQALLDATFERLRNGWAIGLTARTTEGRKIFTAGGAICVAMGAGSDPDSRCRLEFVFNRLDVHVDPSRPRLQGQTLLREASEYGSGPAARSFGFEQQFQNEMMMDEANGLDWTAVFDGDPADSSTEGTERGFSRALLPEEMSALDNAGLGPPYSSFAGEATTAASSEGTDANHSPL